VVNFEGASTGLSGGVEVGELGFGKLTSGEVGNLEGEVDRR